MVIHLQEVAHKIFSDLPMNSQKNHTSQHISQIFHTIGKLVSQTEENGRKGTFKLLVPGFGTFIRLPGGGFGDFIPADSI